MTQLDKNAVIGTVPLTWWRSSAGRATSGRQVYLTGRARLRRPFLFGAPLVVCGTLQHVVTVEASARYWR